MSISDAFFSVCRDSIPAKAYFVTLYRQESFYGGPEEGGWWGHDVIMVATQQFRTEPDAEAAYAAVHSLAERLTDEARQAHGMACAASMDWLNARGLDADYLPEPDGSDCYFVHIEERPGESETRGSRQYE